MEKQEESARVWPFLGLKWKVLILLSLVLLAVNATFAYLVFKKTAGQFETEQANRRLTQIRELNAVFAKGLDSMSVFASFIPLLSTPDPGESLNGTDRRISAILAEHGVMLDVEWGFEGVHYFPIDHLGAPTVSWPEGRQVPAVVDLLNQTRREENPRGQLVCADSCIQIAALPLLQYGRTVGVLVVERSIGDALRDFHLLSGGDLALISGREPGAESGKRQLQRWKKHVSGITHEDLVLSILHVLQDAVSLDSVLDQPQRVQFASEWYEVSAMPAVLGPLDPIVLAVNRVTAQVHAVREATTDSVVVGLTGLLLSELAVLWLMWAPMQRIQDVVHALPLLAEKSFVRLRNELPVLHPDDRPRDEIDVMVDVVGRVSQQIESLDKAHAATEQALRSSEQSLQLAQSMARVVSWSGSPTEGVFRVSQGASRIDKVLEKTLTWAGFLALVCSEDRKRVHEIWRGAKPGDSMDIEFRLTIGERSIDVHAMAEFHPAKAGRAVRAVGMMQDVTEMHAVQEELRSNRDRLEEEVLQRTADLVEARNAAQRLARTKSEFLANMSHEIRTPLNAVLGLSQIGLQQSKNRRIATTFGQILEAGEHLINVVNDVLDLSKLEAGKLNIERQPFELGKTVAQCVDMLRQRVKAKSLQMPVSISDDLAEWVLGDSFRLQQILINLLGNAVKFTEHGSVSLRIYRRSDDYYFEVKDTGIGMSRSQIGNLFAPFHQVTAAPSERQEGTGLGLSISNTLAMLMGGDIQVRSTPGVGSEFVLRLPLRDAADAGHYGTQRAVGSDAREGSRLTGIRALVADDVGMNRMVLEALLEAEGASVAAVSDGAEAVDAVLSSANEPFDIVLMDLQMPVMDGRQATRRIRVSRPDLPIIGVTAHVSEDERRESLASGMNDQLVKPIMQEALVEIVRKYVVDPGGDEINESTAGATAA